MGAVSWDGRLLMLPALVVLYLVAARRDWRWGLGAFLLTLAAMVTGDLLAGVALLDGPPPNPETALVVYAVATAVRYRAELRTALHARAVREEQARAAEERLRLAHEVHDVVGHVLATVSVQAGVAAHVADRRPEQAVAALTAIKKLSDEGLAEIRALLSGTYAPAGLDSLARLLAAVPRVELTVHGTRRALPAPVDAAAYRIIQESLTNAMRHAAAGRVMLDLSYLADRLEIAVRDDGGGGRAAGDGTGIAGMRRRAAAVNGSLVSGPAPGGGFEVRATLPLAERAS